MTRADQVIELLRELELNFGHGAIAEELIEHFDKKNLNHLNLAERVRFGKEIHGTLSTLHDAGKIRRTRTRTNPASGAEVYEYAVEQIQRGPRDKISKSYKEKYEMLVAEMAQLKVNQDKQVKFLMNQRDEARKELEFLKKTEQTVLHPITQYKAAM